MHVDHVCPQPLACNLEAQQRSRGILEEGIDDGQAGQEISMLGALPVKLDPWLRLIEQVEDFVPFQLRDPQKVAMRESEPPRRIAIRIGALRWLSRIIFGHELAQLGGGAAAQVTP